MQKFGHDYITCKCSLLSEFAVESPSDGWIVILQVVLQDFYKSFSTVFKSYQADGRLIMKGCVQWNSFCG